MAIRNGRFKSARVIVTGRADTFFRILNSADFANSDPDLNAFTVKFGNGTGDSILLRPTFSIDVFAKTSVEIIAGTGVVEGMYEALPNAEFKSGRFKTRAPMNPQDGVPIITSGTGNKTAIYRVFNSGSTPVALVKRNLNGTNESPIATVNAEESFDFVTEANKVIAVKSSSTNHIEGIYDFLASVP